MAKTSSSNPIFSGEFRHSLDEKNRVTIPACWRSADADEFYIVKNPKRPSLTVMPGDVFQSIGEDAKARTSAAEHRVFMTHFYSQAKKAAIDKQGRLLLPEDHCKNTGIKSDVVLTGSSDRFELWSPTNWKSFQAEGRATYENVAELVGL